MITKPRLKPVPGFIEVDVSGERFYKSLDTGKLYTETQVLGASKPEPKTTSDEVLDVLLGVTEDEQTSNG